MEYMEIPTCSINFTDNRKSINLCAKTYSMIFSDPVDNLNGNWNIFNLQIYKTNL